MHANKKKPTKRIIEEYEEYCTELETSFSDETIDDYHKLNLIVSERNKIVDMKCQLTKINKDLSESEDDRNRAGFVLYLIDKLRVYFQKYMRPKHDKKENTITEIIQPVVAEEKQDIEVQQ